MNPTAGSHGASHTFTLAEPIAQCAEAKLYRADFYGLPAICKLRFRKLYRQVKLDQRLRELRTLREARALARCRKHGIRCPTLYAVNRKDCTIIMEYIKGRTLKLVLDDELKKITHGEKKEEVKATPYALLLLRGVGEIVGQLHNANITHGDLTTCNFIVEDDVRAEFPSSFSSPTWILSSPPAKLIPSGARKSLVVIDFGLVVDKNSAEERAVDLYVLERAVMSTHPYLQTIASTVILEGYMNVVEPKKGKATLDRLEVVRSRGRKRSMIG
ncbi:unnamed protein product [Phytomonas sp. Hart1]|nr:unnamed protein product [Phytomonas sp. Hart1]|eukprot:CCW70898.1 unnamed protein product [Phytomonas sp. isolate Hart1]